uniref:Uncharacterized protein n=1 Tax=Cacopsylla melanoneura TaxID=428564 RepID=A0A8D9B995_9HEMI
MFSQFRSKDKNNEESNKDNNKNSSGKDNNGKNKGDKSDNKGNNKDNSKDEKTNNKAGGKQQTTNKDGGQPSNTSNQKMAKDIRGLKEEALKYQARVAEAQQGQQGGNKGYGSDTKTGDKQDRNDNYKGDRNKQYGGTNEKQYDNNQTSRKYESDSREWKTSHDRDRSDRAYDQTTRHTGKSDYDTRGGATNQKWGSEDHISGGGNRYGGGKYGGENAGGDWHSGGRDDRDANRRHSQNDAQVTGLILIASQDKLPGPHQRYNQQGDGTGNNKQYYAGETGNRNYGGR